MGTVASPCIRICCLHPETDVCMGCFRSLDEIVGWQAADDAERLQILDHCEARRQAAAKEGTQLPPR